MKKTSHLNIIVSLSLIFIKIMMEWGEASFQLSAKYPQLPALLIGQIGTLIWGIGRVCKCVCVCVCGGGGGRMSFHPLLSFRARTGVVWDPDRSHGPMDRGLGYRSPPTKCTHIEN